MKLLKKGFLLAVLLTAVYILCVFTLPQVAESIDTLIGKPGLSEKIRGGKSTFDTVVTDIPSVQEFKSGAADISTKISGGIDTTKDTIDTIRSWAQKVEETYNGAKEKYDSLRESYEGLQESLSWATQTIWEISGALETVNQFTNPEK
jgi:methyl-accepting chemotaxis protein